MTQEEKYKEALLEARAVLEPCLKYSKGKVREALDSIDKELKSFESEDERIRMELKEAFEAYDIESKWNGIPVRSIIAWLEKQKKPENTSASTMAPSCWEVEQKEQKPVSFSCGHENDKPEWSEEDEDMLNCCISSVEEAKENRYAYNETDGNTSYDREIDWLKSLRPQYHGDVTMTEAYKMGLEAGKASSWKPSEEHLSALLAIFNDPNNIGSQTCQLALTDLYEQLKKL